MKSVTEELAKYLNTQKEMVSCDLYDLTLLAGLHIISPMPTMM